MSPIAVAVNRCYEDANEFSTCQDECAHSGRDAAVDPGGWGPFLLSVLRHSCHWSLSSFPWCQPLHSPYQAMEMQSTSLERLKCQLDLYTYCERPYRFWPATYCKIRPVLKWKICHPHQNYLWLYSSWNCVQSRNAVMVGLYVTTQ